MKPETLERLLADRAAKKPVVLVTDLASGDEQIVYPDDVGALTPALADAIRAVARSDRSETVEIDGRSGLIDNRQRSDDGAGQSAKQVEMSSHHRRSP